MVLKFVHVYRDYINLLYTFRTIASQMISIYQNSFISYTNLITYIVLPCLQQNQAIAHHQLPCNSQPHPHHNITPKSMHQDATHSREELTKENLQNQNFIQNEDKQKQQQQTSEGAHKNKMKSGRKEHVQKYGRNICSNIFHAIIKKVLYQKQYNDVILRIIQKYGMSITVQEFYSKLYFKQNKLKEYVPFNKIIQFYAGTKNKIKQSMARHAEFCRILRIVSRLYLHQEHIPLAFDCQKLKKESKSCHIKETRKLYSIIRGMYEKEYKS